MASHIIGISGRQRSGKDTFAARLISAHGFTRVAFADPLRAVALDLTPWVRVEQDETGLVYGPGNVAGTAHLPLAEVVARLGWEKAKEIREVRRILQVLGVAVRDHVEKDAWVSAALREAEPLPGPVVITDVRFPNEARAVRDLGGSLVRITRPGLPETDLHVSETALDSLVPDYAVANDADLDKLHRQADEVAARVLA